MLYACRSPGSCGRRFTIRTFLGSQTSGHINHALCAGCFTEMPVPRVIKEAWNGVSATHGERKGRFVASGLGHVVCRGSRPHAIAECFDPVAIQSLIAEQSEFMLASDPIQMAVKLFDTNGVHGAEGWAMIAERLWKPYILPRFQINRGK